MDSIFLLDEGARTDFLQQLVQSSSCTYICLWTFLPQPSNCLIFMDGFYNEEDNQPSSSSGTLARRLFDQYRQSLIPLQNDTVPGLAFKNSRPYIEFKDSDLQRLACIEPQLQFYQEAKIKSAIFMGCKTGEIELGTTSNDPQANLEKEMRNWFPEDFSRQNPMPSSSSSSLRSLSMDSPECSPFLFNIISNPYTPEPPKEAQAHHQTLIAPLPTTTNPLQEAMQTLGRIGNVQLPTRESEHAAMTNAILAVISSSSSPSPSSSSSYPPKKPSAFKNYRLSLAPSTQLMVTTRVRRQNMLKRAITFFQRLNLMRAPDPQQVQGSRPTSTQLHHMISERRRREKLNESFQTLRSLLPPGSKKDKASVLTSTTEYMNSLKAQIEELTQRNQLLEARFLSRKEAAEDQLVPSSNERINVQVTDIGESTSDARNIYLQVSLRGEYSLLDLAIRIMEFLKQVKNVKLVSMEANTRMIDSSPIHRLELRLKIEDGDWDKSAFQEAVRRIVADLAQ